MPRASFITSLAVSWGNHPIYRPRPRENVGGREAPVQGNSSQRVFADALRRVTENINEKLEAARDGADANVIEIVQRNLVLSVC